MGYLAKDIALARSPLANDYLYQFAFAVMEDIVCITFTQKTELRNIAVPKIVFF
jgi:hypothetical protein